MDRDARAILTALVTKVEITAPVALPASRDSADKLLFLTRAVNNSVRALHASFRLPAVHSYADLVDSSFHVLRTLHAHSSEWQQPPLAE